MPAALQEAERLEQGYRQQLDEVADIKKQMAAPENSGAPPERVQKFKDMMCERRATALAAFAAESEEERVDRLKAMLSECRTSVGPKPGSSEQQSPLGLGSGSEQHPPAAADIRRSQEFPDAMASVSKPGYADWSEGCGSGEARVSSQQKASSANIYDKLCRKAQATKERLDKMRCSSSLNPAHTVPIISKTSQVLAGPREGEIYDRLSQKALEYKEHIQQMQTEKTRDELSKVSGQPTISKRAQELGKRQGNVSDRLFEFGRQRDARRDKAQKEKQVSIEATLREASPAITQVAANMDRSYDMMAAWDARRKLKIASMRQAQELEDSSDKAHVPRISKNSQAMVKNMKRPGTIGQHLHAQAKLYQQKQQQQQQAVSASHMPGISRHSANMRRDGKVGDRLYDMAKQRQHRQKQRSASAGRERPPNSLSINRRSRTMKRSEPVYEVLYKKGMEYREKARTRIQEEHKTQEPNHTHSKVGARSALLVQMLENRTKTTVMERLTRPTGQLKKSTLQHVEQEHRECTFRPKISPTSKRIDRKVNGNMLEPGQHRRDLLFKKAEQYEFNRAQNQEHYMKLEMHGLSPDTLDPDPQREAEIVQRKTPSRAKSPIKGVAERGKAWVARRNRRLEEARRVMEERNMVECTVFGEPEHGSRSMGRAQSAPRERPPELQTWHEDEPSASHANPDRNEWSALHEEVMGSQHEQFLVTDEMDTEMRIEHELETTFVREDAEAEAESWLQSCVDEVQGFEGMQDEFV
eukprot:TRINITY_DN18088_c0_g2_i5.p1 TRINITY_DN18088_c0_g2~~TRINITY_DN18088_c0_g2_i5.p1  ORF type:complete len:755 (-),score=139.83 TRINITY_DN18088_c0_g2_i5:364-2628(-)